MGTQINDKLTVQANPIFETLINNNPHRGQWKRRYQKQVDKENNRHTTRQAIGRNPPPDHVATETQGRTYNNG
jgi:hypothetical protein